MVVVAHELREQGEQMPLVQHDDVVKTHLAYGPNYPFRDRIRQRRPTGRSDICDAGADQLAPEVIAIHVVPVINQVSRLSAPGVASITCLQIHAAVGLAVTLK